MQRVQERSNTPTEALESETIRRNIETVVQLEERALQQRSWSERIGDAISAFTGTMTFVFMHVAAFGAWIIINLGMLPIQPFDPFPFNFLTLVVSLEAIFLSTFVLMSQNRLSRQGDQRAHLNLQIDMLA